MAKIKNNQRYGRQEETDKGKREKIFILLEAVKNYKWQKKRSNGGVKLSNTTNGQTDQEAVYFCNFLG